MKFIKLFEDFNELPLNIQKDIEDICLELDDIQYFYSHGVKFIYITNWLESNITIYSITNEGRHVRFPVDLIEEVTERLKDFSSINNYKCEIIKFDKSTHYYGGDWHEIVNKIVIYFHKY